MSNYFQRPEDLTSKGFMQAQDLSNNTLKTAGNLTSNNDNGYLKPAGDIPTNDNTKNVGYNTFKPAGTLNTSDYFKRPEDLSSKENSTHKTVSEEITSYLEEVQTGQRTYGPVLGGAKTFVTYDRLKQMVEEGYNIISATYFEQMQMIEVEFDIPAKTKTR